MQDKVLGGPSDDKQSARPQTSWWTVLSDGLEEIIAACLLAVIAGAMALQVVLRTLFAAPLGWPEELAQFLFVWASLFGAIGAIKRSELIRVEFLVSRLTGPWQRIVDGLVVICICALLAVLFWKGWTLASRTSFAAAALPITWAWAYAAIPVFSLIAGIRLLQVRLLRHDFIRIEDMLRRAEPQDLDNKPVQGFVE